MKKFTDQYLKTNSICIQKKDYRISNLSYLLYKLIIQKDSRF